MNWDLHRAANDNEIIMTKLHIIVEKKDVLEVILRCSVKLVVNLCEFCSSTAIDTSCGNCMLYNRCAQLVIAHKRGVLGTNNSQHA